MLITRRIAAWVEMLVILLSEGAGLLIDRVSAQGWQGTVGADRWKSCVAVLKASQEFGQEMSNKITQASSESQKIIEVKKETEPEVDVGGTTAASELVLTAPVAKNKEWERARDRSLAKHLWVSDGSRQERDKLRESCRQQAAVGAQASSGASELTDHCGTA